MRTNYAHQVRQNPVQGTRKIRNKNRNIYSDIVFSTRSCYSTKVFLAISYL